MWWPESKSASTVTASVLALHRCIQLGNARNMQTADIDPRQARCIDGMDNTGSMQSPEAAAAITYKTKHVQNSKDLSCSTAQLFACY